MIDEGTRAAVLRLHNGRVGSRSIAKSLQISRNTVKRVLSRGLVEAQGLSTAREVAGWHDQLVELCSAPELSLAEAHQRLLAKGYCVPYSTFTRYCRQHQLRFGAKQGKKDRRSSEIAWLNHLIQGGKGYHGLKKLIPSLDDLNWLLAKIKTGSLKERKKACTILGRSKGISNRTIASVLHSSPSTTRSYYRMYATHDLPQLFLGIHCRNKDAVAKRVARIDRILELIHDNPKNFGINRTSWSQPSLATAYELKFEEQVSRSTVARSLRELKFSWKKAKRVLSSPDPNYREKVEVLLAKLQSLGQDEQFFFLDELGPLTVKKRGGRLYVPKSTTPKCPRHQVSKGSVTLFGALSATTNQVTWIFGRSKDTWSIIELIELLFNQCQDKEAIYVTWDAVSWHNSIALMEWLDSFNDVTKALGEGPIIEVIPLPTSSQFLNVIEGVFSGMMRAVVHNSDYQSVEEMKLAISRHFCERNAFFESNPKRVGKRIWEADFFADYGSLKSGNYLD